MKIFTTYLSRRHFRRGLTVSLGTVALMAFFSHLYWIDWGNFSSYWPATPQKVLQGAEYWRTLTAVLIHSDLEHFLNNAYMMVFLGHLVYSYFGPLLFPTVALLAAAFTNWLILFTYPPETVLLGSSGMVYFLGGLWPTLYVAIERHHSLGRRLFRATGVSLIIFFPTTFLPEVSYRTHAMGFAVGIVTGLAYFFLNKRRLREEEKVEEIEEEEIEIESESESERKEIQ